MWHATPSSSRTPRDGKSWTRPNWSGPAAVWKTSCLRAARENARTVREIISSEMWLQLNKFYLMVNSAAENPKALSLLQEFFSEVKNASHLFTGKAAATMTHGEAWHFARLGRTLE